MVEEGEPQYKRIEDVQEEEMTMYEKRQRHKMVERKLK